MVLAKAAAITVVRLITCGRHHSRTLVVVAARVELMLGLMMERLSSARTGARMSIAAAGCTTTTNSYSSSSTTTRHSQALQFMPAVVFHCQQLFTCTHPTTAARHSLSTDNYE